MGKGRKVRLKVIDRTGDSVSVVSVDEANKRIKLGGKYLAYDGATNKQISKVGKDTQEVVLHRALVGG